MFDLSWGEMGLIALVALIVIGPKELPQVLRTASHISPSASSTSSMFAPGLSFRVLNSIFAP